MKRDRILTILHLLVIAASIVAFVWWRSTKSLMSEEHPDAAIVFAVMG